MMKTLIYVALGGAIGASGRYAVGVLAVHVGGGPFPWGTILVNIVGSVILGALAAGMAFSWSPSPELRAFLVVGILGGFTTFSAFSLETVLFIEKGRLDLAAVYILGTLVLSVGGLFAGLKLTRAILT
jgi:CrcB protein